MPLEIPAIRILPMSVREPGFSGRSIDDVQAKTFLRDLPKRKGRWRYRATGLNARAGAIVLFQFQARIIASAVFLRDVKFEPGKRAKRGSGGELHFDATSIQTFTPVDAQAMRNVWPGFRGFGHVKQFLNPTCYAAFRRRLRRVKRIRCGDGEGSETK